MFVKMFNRFEIPNMEVEELNQNLRRTNDLKSNEEQKFKHFDFE